MDAHNSLVKPLTDSKNFDQLMG